MDKKKIKFSIGKFSLYMFFAVVDLFTALQTQTQRICCLYLQRLAKLHQILVQRYYPFEFHILYKLHATTAFECTIAMRKYDKTEF